MLKIGTLISAIVMVGGASIVSAADLESLPTKAPEPADNPTTPAKVELGQMLYHDPRLSSTGTVSCASFRIAHHYRTGNPGEDVKRNPGNGQGTFAFQL